MASQSVSQPASHVLDLDGLPHLPQPHTRQRQQSLGRRILLVAAARGGARENNAARAACWQTNDDSNRRAGQPAHLLVHQNNQNNCHHTKELLTREQRAQSSLEVAHANGRVRAACMHARSREKTLQQKSQFSLEVAHGDGRVGAARLSLGLMVHHLPDARLRRASGFVVSVLRSFQLEEAGAGWLWASWYTTSRMPACKGANEIGWQAAPTPCEPCCACMCTKPFAAGKLRLGIPANSVPCLDHELGALVAREHGHVHASTRNCRAGSSTVESVMRWL